MTPVATSKKQQHGARSDYEISISKLAKKVNNKDILKIIPDGLMNDEQKRLKRDTIMMTKNPVF